MAQLEEACSKRCAVCRGRGRRTDGSICRGCEGQGRIPTKKVPRQSAYQSKMRIMIQWKRASGWIQ